MTTMAFRKLSYLRAFGNIYGKERAFDMGEAYSGGAAVQHLDKHTVSNSKRSKRNFPRIVRYSKN